MPREAHDDASEAPQRVELPPTFAFKAEDCSLATPSGTCPPELLAAMARYTRIVLLAGPAIGGKVIKC